MNNKAMPIALRASLFFAIGWSAASISLAQTDMQGGDMQGMSSMQESTPAPATQPAAPALSDANQPAPAEPPFRKTFQNAIAKLNLTPDQKTGIKAVLDQAVTDAQAMRQEMATLSQGEGAQRRREFVRSVLEKLQAQLTADQVKQFKQALAELRPTSRPALAAAGADAAQNDPRARLQRLRSILDGMDLNEDQKAKIDTMLADARTKALAVPADAPDRVAQLEQIRQGIREQLLTILEPDQLQELRSKLPPTAPPPPPPAQASAATTRPSAIVAAMMARRQAEIRAQQRTEAAQNPIASATPTGGPIAIGQPAPPFKLEALDDSVVTSASLHGHVTALVFGSYSSPVFRDRAAGLERLWRKLDDSNSDAKLLIVYTKEAHPSGGWQVDRNKEDHINIAAPSTESERRGEARQAKAALHLTIPFLVDSMDDATATAYGGFPDGAVVINANGTVVATQRWAEPATLERQINEASGKDASASMR